ncbi:chaperone required for assembly of F1-ATPase [Sphingomonas kaistensis]|uniref:Chaperone required for assembly of F1-ATPase n=1 Tax=Sphingomonas kaistensis TaxID=298708 RepID=A0A7X6BGN0_9SPHN|nr:ATP12 family protein [Sphingomonas kaistensis]NJC05256.1 chaperone required for assembly of F1-ATPase [Sphingomonas kaistensis]
MKRFWKDAAAVADEGGAWRIELDGRPVRTPARALLLLPNESLAGLVADEWRAAGETVDPRAMPLTGLANAAIDHVAPRPDSFAEGLARYANSDLLCYRADSPDKLIAAQAAAWDPLLRWARRRYDVDFEVIHGVAPVDQPQATRDRLTQAVHALDPFALAALSPLVTVGGSLVAALALYEGAVGVDEAWHAVSLDERWQLDQWGSDEEAEKAMAAREADFRAGARLLALLPAA